MRKLSHRALIRASSPRDTTLPGFGRPATSASAWLLQDGRPVPLAQQQRQLDVEPVFVDGATASGDRATDTVFHRVGVDGELLGGQLVARPATEEYPQRLP